MSTILPDHLEKDLAVTVSSFMHNLEDRDNGPCY